MISGVEALGSIDEALQQVRRQMRDLDSQIEAHSQQLARIGEEEVDSFRRLASIRLDQITRGEVISRLDETDRRVREILDQRAERIEHVKQRLQDSHHKQSELEAQRQVERTAAAQVTDRLDQAEAATQERLRHDPAHQGQFEKTRQADDVAQQAEKKTEQAEHDLVEKGRPFEADRIFMYLWQRGYGTTRYSANPLFRMLDNWVARLVGYGRMRPNYSMLREIPTRLREHAQRVRGAANQQLASLKMLEEQAAAADGIPAIHEEVKQAEKRIAEIDAQIKAEEDRFTKLSNEQAAFGTGEDELYQRCLALLVDEARRDGIAELRERAIETPTAEDNVIVQRLAEIGQSRDELQAALQTYQQRHERHLSRLQELEKVRHEFKDRGYDGPNSTFSNGALIGAMLNEFLRGLATSPELWRTIQRQQRRRWTHSDPTFGSGGFPGGMGGSWHMPFPGGMNFPMGGGGGGGISGGGGMSGGGGGGGGFRTGGGF